MAARRIDALFGVVKGCRSDVFLEDLKSIVESWGGWSVTTLYITLLVAPTFRIADACESVSLQHKVVCVAEKLGNMLD